MALEIFVGRNACSTAGSGTVDFTSPDSSTTPVAALNLVGRAITDATLRADGTIGAGIADGTSQYVSSIGVNDAAVTVDAVKGRDLSSVADLVGGAQVWDGIHTHNSFIAGGQRLNDTNGFSAAELCNSMFFAGANVSVEEVTLSATVDTAVNVDPGFAWDVAIVISSGMTTGTSNDSDFSFGYMTAADDVQGCIMYNTNNGTSSPGAPNFQISSTYAGGKLNNGASTLQYGIDVQVGSGTSCDVFPRTAGGSSHLVRLLFIGFTDGSSAKIIAWDSPTATGNDAITGAGLTPIASIDLLSYAAAYDTGESDADGGAFAIGLSTADSQFCIAVMDEDATGGNSGTNSWNDNVSVSLPLDDGTTSATTSLLATHVSFDSDGKTMNWTNRDSGTARKEMSLFFGSSAGIAPQAHHHYQHNLQ